MRNETVLFRSVAAAGLVVAGIDVIGGPHLSAGPYPTVVGLAERAPLAAGAVWLAIALFEVRDRTPEVTR